MNEKWFDECSVVAYPHEIRFLNIDGGSMSYYVDRHVSEYVGKIQAQLNTLQNENRDKNIKNMILQSKIDKANELLEEILVVSDWEHEGRFRPVKGTTAQDVYKTIVKLNELLETPRRINYELLKEDK